MSIRAYAITDSHQECRNLSALLSEITKIEKGENSSFIFLDCGDIFKGIYDKDLCVDMYLKFKELNPKSQMIVTVGNNDFGFKQEDFEYYKEVQKKFKAAGISVVCSNLKDIETDEYSKIFERYKILEIEGKRILVLGFCLNTSIMKNFGLRFEDSSFCLQNLVRDLKGQYDYLFVLNHHWYSYSKDLYEFAKNNGIKIDLIIGGHEHSKITPDFECKIFYPFAFARSLYRMELKSEITDIVEVPVEGLNILPQFENPLENYESNIGLYKPIAKRVLNLVKWYSEPCALGTFISDNMRRIANTDIAFHSTGFTMYSLKTDESDVITKYDFEKVICASTPIVKVYANTEVLKKVFENATLNRMYKNNGNARFIQCSQNVCITGKGNPVDKSYKIIQIEINGEKLLDKNQKPINPDKTFTCAIDEFISKGEQGYIMLKDLKKEKITNLGKEVHLNELLLDSLIEAQKLYKPKTEYPVFGIIDL